MDSFNSARRELLKLSGIGLAAAAATTVPAAYAATRSSAHAVTLNIFDIRTYGAIGDGKTLDTAAINKAIDAAAGGGTVLFPAGHMAIVLHPSQELRPPLPLAGRNASRRGLPAESDCAEPNSVFSSLYASVRVISHRQESQQCNIRSHATARCTAPTLS